MAAVLFLIGCMMAGWLAASRLFPAGAPVLSAVESGEPGRNAGRSLRINRIWPMLAMSFGTGVLLAGWMLYILAFLLHVSGRIEDPLRLANPIAAAFLLLFLAVSFLGKREKKGRAAGKALIGDRSLFRKECLWYGALFLFILFTMAYVFHQTGDRLYAGFTVFGDYAPHTAMMRSFSRSANFPAQYPHFGGEDIKYHFMFQFLVGNLEYLGMRLDIAYNLMGTLSLWGFLVMLCQMAYRLSGRFCTMVIAPALFFFRSGTAFFRFIGEHLSAGDLGTALSENTSFLGYTANENWGLWNYNVYLNQRHLGFGLLLTAGILWLFWDSLEAGIRKEETGAAFLKGRFFSRTAWKARFPEKALLSGVLLGLCSFWNGACVIGGLLILFGMALFSDGKLDYLILAITTVLLSWLETRIFIFGQAVEPSWYWGFLSADKSLPGVLHYLVQVTGITVAFLIPAAFLMKRPERVLTAAFVIPVIFSFCFSLTPDINVNHKYIMISMAFLAMIWSSLLCRLLDFGKGSGKVGFAGRTILALCLAVLFMATGIYDFAMILRGNDAGHRVSVFMKSELTDWLSEHLTEKDLILTPEYSMNEITMSGSMLYLGWPYYAWSAGYDTYYRKDKAILIYSTDREAVLKNTVEKENIDYILFEEGMKFEETECREDVIRAAYPEVYRTSDQRIRIYRTGGSED